MNSKPAVLNIIGSDFLGAPEKLIMGQLKYITDFEIISASFVKRGKKNEFLSAANSKGYGVEAIEDNYPFDPKIPGRIKSIIVKYDVKLVVTHGYKADFYGFLARVGRDVPRVAYFHGWTQENMKMKIYNIIDRKILPRLDSIIAVSEASADRLTENGVSKSKIQVVYNAIEIDDNIQKPAPTIKEKPTIGVISRLSYEKGIHIFIRALAETAKNRGEFVARIYGDGGELENLKKLARELKLDHIIRFMGFTDDIEAAYKGIDFLVIPSLSEGHPLVILEAWKHGLGIVAAKVGGIPEVIEDGSDGVLVEAGNPQALGTAILQALNDRKRMNSLGEAGFFKLKKKYSFRFQADRLTQIYGSLIK